MFTHQFFDLLLNLGQDDLDNQGTNNYAYDAIGRLIKDDKEDIHSIEWNVANKITKITKGSLQTITFEYDPMGNRISKKDDNGAGIVTTTYYVRDAQGNVMTTYKNSDNSGNVSLKLNDIHLYGSSRLGTKQEDLLLVDNGTPVVTFDNTFRKLGEKRYELSNHLGNVPEVISDRKLCVDDGGGNVDYYTADVVSYSDYYPFGMLMPNRHGSDMPAGEDYDYGFNGALKDNELKGNSNSYDLGARMYDNRTGRFLSLDPLWRDFTSISHYSYASNSPIAFIDIDGLGPILVVASFTQSKSIETALKNGDTKEVQRILYYAATHDYVDSDGKKSNHLRERIKKEHNEDVPEGGSLMNLGNTQDGVTKIYGIREGADGKTEAYLLGEVKLDVFNEEVDKEVDYTDKTPVEVFDQAIDKNVEILDRKIKPIQKKLKIAKDEKEEINRTIKPVVSNKGETWGALTRLWQVKRNIKDLEEKKAPLEQKKEQVNDFKESKGEK